jgi:predicted nucleic acid-binding protein
VKAFLDTSVMIAAFWGDHARHEASSRVFVGANRQTGACGMYSLAEVFAVMTALPVRPPIAPEQAFLFVEQISQRLSIVALNQAEYLRTVRELADRNLGGGRVYDALLLACARKSRAEAIYTWDEKHFRQIAPDLAARIRTP